MHNEKCSNAWIAHSGIIARTHLRSECALCRTALEATALTLRESAPDTEALIMSERVFETFLANIAGLAYALCFASGATLLREESLRIGLSAE
jgi:hypothetical protein